MNDFIKSIPKGVKLVAVSKTHSCEIIRQVYDNGFRIFGENKPQELVKKYNELPKDIEWHFIGHLQTNKVKYIAPFVELIHSVDSPKLLAEINKEAAKQNRTIKCLLQVHIAKEETKFGFTISELQKYLSTKEFLKYNFVNIVGIMGIATYTNDTIQIRNEFHSLRKIFDTLKETTFANNLDFCELSMGMSNDYKIAINEGSTIVRIGSLIFGERDYSIK
ncbi:MAG: YggS family pyridoxal phosphate-dependent enzyme [Prevotellaceae bacterium]|jgi:pyridoxal phosphate enzyme (YggS family)|nr:YggS family pyridoxal phosphate-dependent enzyme [Prevotellaceae bacterium]